MLEVAKNIFCFPVPLPGSPLKELNCYIIKGDKRNLMIDVGYNSPQGYKAIMDAFEELKLSISDTDIFLTHMHADHTGLVEKLKHDCGKIYISQPDSRHVKLSGDRDYWINAFKRQDHMGWPMGTHFHYRDHPAWRAGNQTEIELTITSEGDIFSYGGYDFEVIDLKGHTPGQLGLYNKEHSILFSGDHILNKISPNVTLWDFTQDYLGLFLANLLKVKALNIKTLLSGHRSLIADVNGRIDQLLAHHERRLNRTLEILASGKTTVYDVALDTEWDYGGGYFGDFPGEQKWFASNETFAHLEHLRYLGKVDYTVNPKDRLTYHYQVK